MDANILPLTVETPETLNCLVNNVAPVTVVIPAKVETPETLNCLVNNVSPVTVVIPAKVESPVILACCDVKLVILVLLKVVSLKTLRVPFMRVIPFNVERPTT